MMINKIIGTGSKKRKCYIIVTTNGIAKIANYAFALPYEIIISNI